MKIRITQRKTENSYELSVDTETSSKQLFVKTVLDETKIPSVIDDIALAASSDSKDVVKSIDSESDSFITYIIDSPMNFDNEEDYKRFCEALILLEANKPK